MTDLLDLVELATADTPWDPDRLVAAAAATGRARLRRRRAGATLAACAVLGAAGTGLALAGSGHEAATRGVDPATHRRASSAPSPAPTPSPLDTTPWRLAVTAAQVPDTFGRLVPGTVTTVPNKEMDDSAPIVDFRWNGYAVQVGLTPDDYVDGSRVIDPGARCREQGSSGVPCSPGSAPGSYEQSMTATGPAEDGGVTVRAVTVYFAQGWDVMVSEANAADTKGAPLLSADLPLSLDQLRQVAYSAAWFTVGSQVGASSR